LALHEMAGVVGSLIAISFFVYTSSQRLFYLFTLTPSEGVVLEHVQRLLAAKPLYVQPSLDWVPLLYTPLYYFVSKLFIPFFGENFTPLRLVSVLSTYGCMGLLGAFAYKETGKRTLGLLAAGLFSAMYVLTLSWYDTARVDMLALFFLLASFYTLRFGRGTRAGMLTALFFTLSFLTKQTALVALPMMVLFSIYRDRRGSLRIIVPIGFALLLTFSFANWMTQGWFTYYAMTLPSLQPRSLPFAQSLRNLFPSLLPLYGLIAAGAFWGLSGRLEHLRIPLFYYGGLLGSLGVSAMFSSMKIGGDVNHFIPALAVSAVLSVIVIDRLAKKSANLAGRRYLQAGIACLVLFQFVFLKYPSSNELPSRAAQHETQDARLQAIRNLDGDLFFLHSDNYLARLAGKKPYANFIAITDILWTAPSEHATTLVSELRQGIESRRFGGIIVDLTHGYDAHLAQLTGDLSDRSKPGLLRTVRDHYELAVQSDRIETYVRAGGIR
jgi:hypothetical protein